MLHSGKELGNRVLNMLSRMVYLKLMEIINFYHQKH
nr:MAG TPA: hypothetical protein [Caudoviricetes sp.]